MRVLLDACVFKLLGEELARAGHDVRAVADLPQDPGDEQIMALAHRERRVLITYDKDFGELAVLGGADHSGIIRLVVMPLAAQVQACQLILANHGPALLSGAIATAERGRIRIRMAADETAD